MRSNKLQILLERNAEYRKMIRMSKEEKKCVKDDEVTGTREREHDNGRLWVGKEVEEGEE
jgi:hypothetical protein